MQELFSEDPLPDQLAFDSGQARSALEGLVQDPLYGRACVICDGEAPVGYLVLR